MAPRLIAHERPTCDLLERSERGGVPSCRGSHRSPAGVSLSKAGDTVLRGATVHTHEAQVGVPRPQWSGDTLATALRDCGAK